MNSFQYRKLNTEWQVYGEPLSHICMCQDETLAQLITGLLNKSPVLSPLLCQMGDFIERLKLIAAPMRPDGTFNRDRSACQKLAKEVLEKYGY